MAARRILTLVVLTTLTSTASGSPRSDPTTGRAVFTGATLPHPTSISLDPAALGLGATNQIYVALTSVLQRVTIDRRSLDLDTGALTTGPSVTDNQLGPGGMLAFVWHTSERLTLGFGVRLPPPELHPDGHDALRYHTLGGGQRSYLATVGGSFKVTSKFYFGVSLSHENTSLRLRHARDTALEAGRGANGITSDCGGAPCGVENPLAAEIYDVAVRSPLLSTENLTVNLGTVLEVAPGTWVALAYHTPRGFAIQATLEGSMDVTRAPRDGGDLVRGGATVNVSYPASVDAEVRSRLPRSLDLHVGGRWEDLSRFQAYDVRGYGSTFPDAGIPEWTQRARGMRDAFAAWAGVEQVDIGQPLRFGGRLGFETAAVTAGDTSPLTVSPAAVTLDGGVQWRLSPAWMLQLSYGLALGPGVDADPSHFDPRLRIDCLDSGFDYTTAACAATRDGYAVPTAAGHYTRLDHAFRLGFRYELP